MQVRCGVQLEQLSQSNALDSAELLAVVIGEKPLGFDRKLLITLRGYYVSRYTCNSEQLPLAQCAARHNKGRLLSEIRPMCLLRRIELQNVVSAAPGSRQVYEPSIFR